jgi:anti-sigma factor RsiW
MNETKTICTEVEGLLPLYVGGDLEKDQLSLVSEHLQKCTPCTTAFGRTRNARGLLRAELIDLVDGREPQLWPALREQLQAEGLFKQTARGVSEGSDFNAPSDNTGPSIKPAPTLAGQSTAGASTPALTGFFGAQRLRRSVGIAAGLTAMLFLGKMLPDSSTLPSSSPGADGSLAAGGSALASNTTTESSGQMAPGTTVPEAADLVAPITLVEEALGLGDSLLASGAPVDVQPQIDVEQAAPALGGGLSPVGFGEQSLADVVRENIREEARARAGQPVFFSLPRTASPQAQSRTGLASDFSIQ